MENRNLNYFAFLGPLLGWGTGAALGSVALTSGSLLQAAGRR